MTNMPASPEVSGTPIQTCARCGHQTGGCPRCGRDDDELGASIDNDQYCHVNSDTAPTCYMLACQEWERRERDAYLFGRFYVEDEG